MISRKHLLFSLPVHKIHLFRHFGSDLSILNLTFSALNTKLIAKAPASARMLRAASMKRPTAFIGLSCLGLGLGVLGFGILG